MSDERSLQYAQKLSRMVQEPTISAYGETDLSRFYRFHDLLRELFPNLFRVCEAEDFNGSLLLRWRGRDASAEPILFMNHFDVVEAGGAWTHAPFSGDIADGRVWGRGTLDTKGGLCCMLQAAEELIAEGFVPPCDVYFESACTEECDGTGADTISQALAERGVHFRFLLDEGGMMLQLPLPGLDRQFAMVGVGEKGCAEIRFVARSNGGHASTPGKNTPLARLSKFVLDVERSRIFTTEISPTVRETLVRIAPGLKGSLRLLLSHPRLFSPLLRAALPKASPLMGAMLRTTLAFTMAGGSDAANVLPAEAWIVGNMRFSHHQGADASFDAVRRIAARNGVEMIVTDSGFSSPISDFRAPDFARADSAIRSLFPSVTPVPFILTAASDSRYFSRVCDVCLRFVPFFVSPQQLDSIHGVDENVSLSSLAPAVDFYKLMMQ